MNVTSVGTIPAPLPAPFPVQRPAGTSESADAGKEASQHAAQQATHPEPEPVKLPPIKPVSTQEFRVMLGALPASVLHRQAAASGTGDHLDLYA